MKTNEASDATALPTMTERDLLYRIVEIEAAAAKLKADVGLRREPGWIHSLVELHRLVGRLTTDCLQPQTSLAIAGEEAK